MKKLLLACFIASVQFIFGQSAFQQYCQTAYQLYPSIPRGVLEAHAFIQTRMQYLNGSEMESCSGLPLGYGYFGLIENGKNYFKENLKYIATKSHYSIQQIKTNPQTEVIAVATVWNNLLLSKQQLPVQQALKEVLYLLSYIPDTGNVNLFAKDAEAYEFFRFLSKVENAQNYQFQPYSFQFEELFGSNNYTILSSPKIELTENGIQNSLGIKYETINSQDATKSAEYGPAIWNAAPSCNFSSRNGTAISAITIHTIQGTYAGAISWSQNCNSSVSFHYVLRSSDGQVTQMVLESKKAWHVGSENPYTIGYEHEGYVSQTGWYTTAMYNASAGITRDICNNSGYGINPLRTFFGNATSTSNVLGSCTKVKGHQHYPNQTHTDPGINWDWKLYYNLVNNNPSITTVTSATGTFTDSGGSGGAYTNDERTLTLIKPTGATSVSINFSSFNLENNWDFLFVYDGQTTSAPLIGIYTGTSTPGILTSTAGAMLLEFRSDCATTASGWVATWTSQNGGGSNDVTPPSTAITTPGSWVTQDFTASFTDSDNSGGSGIEKMYYQVIDFDGTDWRANSTTGFFSDNFDQTAIHSDWTTVQGNWNLNTGNLVQSDESNGNTNIYAAINHGLSNRYLYHWAGSMSGSGTNRRAGFHYFCDNPTLTNRGNSYFVFFRLDDDKIQLYKVTNDVFTLQNEVTFDFNANQWYDYKIIYDRITGKHTVYIDNDLVQAWTDSSPLSGGDYFSFRTGNCVYAVNNLKIYRSRAASSTVTVGSTKNLRFQSQNPSTVAGKVKSIIQDNAGNLSSISQQELYVDWTPPSTITTVNDGQGADVSTTTNASTIYANWSQSIDTHSNIAKYWVAVGTSPGAVDVVNWTDNNWDTTITLSGLSLNQGTTYYFSVRSENGAGLLSTISSSNGQTLIAPTGPPVASFEVQNTFVCVTDSIELINNSQEAISFLWTAYGASNPTSTLVTPKFNFQTSGTYTIQLIAYGPLTSDTIEQQISIQVSQLNQASFNINNDTLYIPNAILTCTNNSTNSNGYSWFFGDGGGSQDANPWHQYTQNGLYVVKLIAVNDACPEDTASQTIVVLSPLSIEHSSTEEIEIYPNPASSYIILKVPLDQYEIMIRDEFGRIVQQDHVVGSNYELRLSQLAQGIYHVTIQSGDSNWTQKLLIK